MTPVVEVAAAPHYRRCYEVRRYRDRRDQLRSPHDARREHARARRVHTVQATSPNRSQRPHAMSDLHTTYLIIAILVLSIFLVGGPPTPKRYQS